MMPASIGGAIFAYHAVYTFYTFTMKNLPYPVAGIPVAEPAALSDEALIKACCHGDTDGFAQLYQRYYQKVYCTCRSMLRDTDTARDVTQDSLLKAYEKIRTFQGTSTFSTWLFAITRNECLQYLRKTRRRPVVPLTETYDVAEEESEQQLQRQRREEMVLAISLRQLSPEERQLLLMKYCQEASVRDIQQCLGLATPSAVKMRLQRARAHMHHCYQQVARTIN